MGILVPSFILAVNMITDNGYSDHKELHNADGTVASYSPPPHIPHRVISLNATLNCKSLSLINMLYDFFGTMQFVLAETIETNKQINISRSDKRNIN